MDMNSNNNSNMNMANNSGGNSGGGNSNSGSGNSNSSNNSRSMNANTQGSGSSYNMIPRNNRSMATMNMRMGSSRIDMKQHRNARKQRYNEQNSQNIYRMEEMYKQYETPDEVFETIVCHEAKGVTFHDKMIDVFGFLGLYGFKKLHEYRFIAESLELIQTKCYVLDHLNMLTCYEIDEKGLGIIPEEWYSGMREDVTPEERQEYCIFAFKLYKQWEEETRELYSFCANELMALNRTADFQEIAEKVKDEDEEIKHLEKLCIKLDSVGWDMSYIMNMQEELEHEYNKKLEKLFEEKVREDKVRKHHKIEARQGQSNRGSNRIRSVYNYENYII